MSLAFVVVGLSLVATYVAIARSTFESDKISYVFDSQQTQLESVRKDIRQKINESLVLSKSLLATYDFGRKSLNEIGQSLFEGQALLLAVSLEDLKTGDRIIKIEKAEGMLNPHAATELRRENENDTVIVPSKSPGQLEIISSTKSKDGESTRLRSLIDLGNILPENPTLSFAITFSDKILLLTGDKSEHSALEEFAAAFSRNRAESTAVREFQDEKYLVSHAEIGIGELHVLSLTSEKEALGALGVLYKRSLAFIILSGFLTVLISILISRGLTGKLNSLTESAVAIGKGDFSTPPEIKSSDEVGVLSFAFRKMVDEIKRLLQETQDKARMEAELKTASLVQESLLPQVNTFRMLGFGVSGRYATSTECGGDWWYYFRHNDDLYLAIADATGHGTPAALITASARSLFSKLEGQPESLTAMMKDWDKAVADCSGQKVFMTAILMRINLLTGEGQFVNACHEPPILFTSRTEGYEAEFIEMHKGSSLGERDPDRFREQPIKLMPGQKLLLFTDGLLAVTNKSGKIISETRLVKSLVQGLNVETTAERLVEHLFELVERQREGTALPDDVTAVAVSFEVS